MPHGAPEFLAYGIVTVFSVFLTTHWIRRAFRSPHVTEPAASEARSDITVFDKVQRAFHWATTASLAMVMITGFALYDPFTFEPVTDALGIPLHSAFPSWVLWHVISTVSFAALLVVHVIWDVKKLGAIRRMLPNHMDLRDGVMRARNFLFITTEYPKMDKYDLFMKNFHIYLAVSVAVLAFTGIYQYLYAPWWTVIWFLHYQIEPLWRPTVIHDVFGFILIALVIGHVYFSLLKVNRPLFKAMIRGKVDREEANRRYRIDRLEQG